MLVLLTLVVAVSYAATKVQLIDVTKFKTAAQIQVDILDDPDNFYGLAFYKSDTTNFELTTKNKKILDQLKQTATDFCQEQNADEKTKYFYYAEIDNTVPENDKLWKKFNFYSNDTDHQPTVVALKESKGKKFTGPAIVSLFKDEITTLAGPPPAAP